MTLPPRQLDEIVEHVWRHDGLNASHAEALIREAYMRGRLDCAHAVPVADPWAGRVTVTQGSGAMHDVAPVDQEEVAKTLAMVQDANAKNLHAHEHGRNGEFEDCTRTECVTHRRGRS